MIEILLMEKQQPKQIDNKSKSKKAKSKQEVSKQVSKIDVKNLGKKHQFKGIGYLHFACINPNCLDLIKEMLDNGYSLDFKDKHE